MNTLFPLAPIYPEGFSYQPDFITREEEVELLKVVAETELHHFNFQGFKANRKVASFGYDYGFDNRDLTKGKPIPATFSFLIDKISHFTNLAYDDFVELLVTEYPPGAVINWHRDAAPFDIIAGISLFTDCIFRLRPHDKEKQTRNNIISFPVIRRSLYIMQGAARSEWQHSIAPVKDTRYSITLRTIRG
jgi:alkylated DNA repair dioxygenase AlkB